MKPLYCSVLYEYIFLAASFVNMESFDADVSINDYIAGSIGWFFFVVNCWPLYVLKKSYCSKWQFCGCMKSQQTNFLLSSEANFEDWYFVFISIGLGPMASTHTITVQRPTDANGKCWQWKHPVLNRQPVFQAVIEIKLTSPTFLFLFIHRPCSESCKAKWKHWT